MEACGGTQIEDWEDFSDSELLEVLSQTQNIESQQAPDGQDDAESSAYVHSPGVSSASELNAGDASDHGSVQTEDLRGDKRKSLHNHSFIPMQRFLKRHLSVTLLCDQSWCEMKTVYGLLKPHMKRNDMRRPEVRMGRDIHLSRELEIQSFVPVDIRTREEAEAVKLLNVIHMMQQLEAGECVREFPVFGVLDGVFIMGVIDELRYNQKGELALNELKTRRHNSMPSSAQDKVNCFQAGLYKLLFDGLVRREVKKEHVLDHLQLRSHQVLGAGLQTHARSVGVHVDTFEDVLDAFLISVSCSDVPCIDLLQIEYYHQGSEGPIGNRIAPFDEARLRQDLKGFLAYWRGEREPKGVDIEDAWKCKSCLYEQTCEWTKNKSQLSDQHAAGSSLN